MTIVSIVDVLYGRIAIDNEIIIRGWVRTRRDSKIGLSFLTIYDGSCFGTIQVIVHNNLSNYHQDILKLTTGCSVIVTGKLIKSPSHQQSYEITARVVEVVGWIEDPQTYPMSSKYHSLEYLRIMAHLRPRTNLIGAVSRIRHTLAQAIHNVMNNQGFFWVTTPLITATDTEGSGLMFRVSTLDLNDIPCMPDGKVNFNKDFFGKEAFLTVSGQLTGESYACALSKIYTFGPIFRAENSNTTRHLAEFWMLELEMAFASLEEIIDLTQYLLKFLFKKILFECTEDMNFFNSLNKEVINRLYNFIDVDLITIEYSEVIKILKNCNQSFKNEIYWGIDLSVEHERYLTEKYFNAPIIIKNFPKENKAFYMRLNDDGVTVAAMDVIMPGIGEIVGGSQREERLTQLDSRFIELGLNKEEYWWYRDLRRYGSVPHSGFGLGFERLIAYITGIQNIRDIIPFPRYPKNINF